MTIRNNKVSIHRGFPSLLQFLSIACVSTFLSSSSSQNPQSASCAASYTLSSTSNSPLDHSSCICPIQAVAALKRIRRAAEAAQDNNATGGQETCSIHFDGDRYCRAQPSDIVRVLGAAQEPSAPILPSAAHPVPTAAHVPMAVPVVDTGILPVAQGRALTTDASRHVADGLPRPAAVNNRLRTSQENRQHLLNTQSALDDLRMIISSYDTFWAMNNLTITKSELSSILNRLRNGLVVDQTAIDDLRNLLGRFNRELDLDTAINQIRSITNRLERGLDNHHDHTSQSAGRMSEARNRLERETEGRDNILTISQHLAIVREMSEDHKKQLINKRLVAACAILLQLIMHNHHDFLVEHHSLRLFVVCCWGLLLLNL